MFSRTRLGWLGLFLILTSFPLADRAVAAEDLLDKVLDMPLKDLMNL